jgi:hypothetical protein
MPKGVMLSHDNLTFTAQMLVETYHLKEKVKTITGRQLVSINVKDVDKTCNPKEKVFSLIIIKSIVLFFIFFYVKHS